MKIFLIFVGPMSLSTLLADLAAHMQTDQFRLLACDPEHPTAFQHRRKLPLPALIALMLTGMRKSVQTEPPSVSACALAASSGPRCPTNWCSNSSCLTPN
jgi:hypothetical protein